MKKNAIVFTANTVHVTQANLMISSLFDEAKGNFKGDLWVISTHLSKRCQLLLESKGINYLINPLVEFNDWTYRESVAKAQPEYIKSGLSVDDAFLVYRNKRMSKLIVCDWVSKFGDRYESMAVCDNDLYFQRDVNELFEKTQVDNDVVWYWQEENQILPGTNLWKKNFNYARFHDVSRLNFGKHEINIGFIVSNPQVMKQVFSRVKELFSQCDLELFTKCLWHDQDLVRLIRAQSPELFRLFDEGDVLHLCNGGKEVVDERFPAEFYHKKTEEKPYVVHFAGGIWKGYPSIAQSYRVHDGTYFFMNEQEDSYDSVRSITDYDPFASSSVFFSDHNIMTKNVARKHWMDLKKTSDKKSLLFFSWLDTGSHQPLKGILQEFLNDKTFDLAVIDGNVKQLCHEDLMVEDLPNMLARVTQTIENKYFARAYGYKRSDVPEKAISGAIAALVKEYRCSERAARAVANAAYLYLMKVLAFYRPNVVVCWGAYLLCPRILKYICKQLGIPCITMELGVLPKTLAFDCLGHMGESWVSRDSDLFNSLPLVSSDYDNGRGFLKKAIEERFSRNCKLDTPSKTRFLLEKLKKTKKKVVLYVGSNCSFSGNVPYDERAKKYHSPFFKDNDDVVSHLSQVFSEDANVHVVYKPHPITITRGLDLTREYPNITVISDANLDECLAAADLVLAKVSQGSYEALLRDKPVLMLGVNQINESGAVYNLNRKETLYEDIITALRFGYTAEQKERFEEHVTRLLKYYLYNISDGEGAREQSKLLKDIQAILNGNQPEHMELEKSALDAYALCDRESDLDNPKISIIMPVYNGEEYLVDCIGSLLTQTFTDFELICVNNGSTDGSQEILDYFVAQDTRIRAFYQEEPNQRTARNLGVRNARGKYLHFFDCDDLFVSDAYECLYSVIEEKKADVLYFFFNEMYDTMKVGQPRYREYFKFLPNDEVFKMEAKHKPLFSQYPFPWAKIFNKEFFIKNELYFDLDCDNYDDNPQNLRTLCSSDNIYVCNKAFYKFRINQNSMTQSVNPRAFGMLDAVRVMNDIYESFDCYEHYQPYYVPYKIHLLHFGWTRLPEELREEYITSIKSMFLPGDEDFFRKDEMISLFNYLTEDKVVFIEKAISGDFLYSDLRVLDGVETRQDQVDFYPEHTGDLYANVYEARIVEFGVNLLEKHPKLFAYVQKLYRTIRPLDKCA